MNILIISGMYSSLPKSGGSLVMKLYVEELRRQGHNVYLLYETSEDNDPTLTAQQTGNYYLPTINNQLSASRSMAGKLMVKITQALSDFKLGNLSETEKTIHRYFYRDYTFLTTWLKDFSKQHTIDIIQVDFPWLMNLPAFLPHHVPVVFISHETQTTVCERQATQQPEKAKKDKLIALSRLYKQHETKLGKSFKAILTLSEDDREVWQSFLPGHPTFLSPLGIDIKHIEQEPGIKGEKIVFVGNGKHAPNVDGLRFFFTEIWPYLIDKNPSIRFHITGEYDSNFKSAMPKADNIIWAGFVDDLPALMHNSVSIVPIRVGSGIRIKILESMAMGAPVVSTLIGAEGIIAEGGKSILLADDPIEFGNKVLALFDTDSYYQQIAHEAKQAVTSHYNLPDTVARRIALYEKLLRK